MLSKILDPNQLIQDYPIIDRKIQRGIPLTDEEALIMFVQSYLSWGEDQITLRELFRRIMIIGSLLDLDLP